jgi:hypothetical protein
MHEPSIRSPSSIAEQLRARLGQVDLVQLPLGGPSGTTSADLQKVDEEVRSTDLTLVVVGERTGWSGALPSSGEGRDRQSLSLPGDQAHLVETVIQTGVPTVVILVSGRPLDIEQMVASGATVLFAPHLAAEGPHVVVSALLGEVVPAGRLPISWPRTVGQIPVFSRARTGSPYGPLEWAGVLLAHGSLAEVDGAVVEPAQYSSQLEGRADSAGPGLALMLPWIDTIP